MYLLIHTSTDPWLVYWGPLWGSLCCMSTFRNTNVTCVCRLFSPCHVLSLRNGHVTCYILLYLHVICQLSPGQTLQVNDNSCSLQGVANSSWRLLQPLQHVEYHVLAMVYFQQFMCNYVLAKKVTYGVSYNYESL